MSESCLTPTFPFIGSSRVFYVISCTAIFIVSIPLQIIFLLICQKMKGWKSNFAFYLLQIMTFFSLLNYVGSFASYIHGLILFDSPAIARVIGSNHQSSYFTHYVAYLFLTIHRFFYTLFPLRAQLIFTKRVVKIGIAFIFIFYGTFLVIFLTPLVFVEFCPARFFFFTKDAPLYPMLLWTNRVSSYATAVVGVTAYGVMFITLYIKGSLTFRRNSEIRMTAQVAVVSVFELLFFVYWEFGAGALESVSEFWRCTLDGYSNLIYYDVLILPYMIFNESVKEELKDLIRKKKSTTPLMVLQVPQRSLKSSG